MNRVGVARYVLYDLFQMAPGPVLSIAPLGLASAFTRLVSAGLLVQFIASYTGDRDAPRLDVLWFDLGIEADSSRAWYWVFIIGTSAATAALLGYLTALAQLRLGRRYSLHVANRTLNHLVDHPYKASADFDPSFFVFGASGLLGIIAPALTALTFGVTMFVMRPGLSLVVTAIALVFLGPVMIAATRRIVDATHRRHSTRNVMRAHADPALSLLAAGPLYERSMRRAAVSGYVREASFVERFESLYLIRINQQRARMMSGLLRAVTAVALVVGLTIVEQPNSIETGSLILYIVVAQFATAAIGQIGVELATFSRYLYAYERYIEFVSPRGNRPQRVDPAHAGEVWLVRDKEPPNAAQLESWLDAIGLNPSTRATLTLDPENFPEQTVASMLVGGWSLSSKLYSRSSEFANGIAGRQLSARYRAHFVTDLDPNDPVLGAISLSPAAMIDDPMVVVHRLRTFCRLDIEQQKIALENLDHHHVILVGHGRDYVEGLVDQVLGGTDIERLSGLSELEDD